MAEKKKEVFVLTDCPYSKCGEVVEMPENLVKQAKELSMVDDHKDAVAAGKKAAAATEEPAESEEKAIEE